MTGLYGYIIGGLVVVLAFAGTLLKGWQSGAARERDRQASAELAARTEGQKIDDAVAGRSGDENRGRLRGWSPKP